MKNRTCVRCVHYLDHRGTGVCGRTVEHWFEHSLVCGERVRQTRHSYCSIERRAGILMAVLSFLIAGQTQCTSLGLFWRNGPHPLPPQGANASQQWEDIINNRSRELPMSPRTRERIAFAVWCLILILVDVWVWKR
jgi:predicted nucleic acid-binding Zn ribbon protein